MERNSGSQDVLRNAGARDLHHHTDHGGLARTSVFLALQLLARLLRLAILTMADFQLNAVTVVNS
jgi:hypothetical protein